MLKRISPRQAEMGMFIHNLEGRWLKHPFWRSKFVLEDNETLTDLREAEIDAVIIDISKGRDLPPPRSTASTPLPTPVIRTAAARRAAPTGFDFRSSMPTSTAREFGNAGKVAERCHKIVSRVFLEARLGKTFQVEAVEPVIGEIFASIQRNPHAFNGLMRCKRDNEYVYRHALSCAALMISLGRQLRLDPATIRQAGLAGLLFDVGVNHLPVDLAESGGEFRHLPHEVLAAHTRLGYDFLIASGVEDDIALVALRHHERADATGYPEGLGHSDLALLSRMAAVCDAYDTMASNGTAAAPDPGAAVAAMAAQAGTFDAEVFDAFVQSIGVYPIGTVVRFASDRLAMVVDLDSADSARPVVRTFYSLRQSKRLNGETIALANCYGEDSIAGLGDMGQFEPEEVLELRHRLLMGFAKVTA